MNRRSIRSVVCPFVDPAALYAVSRPASVGPAHRDGGHGVVSVVTAFGGNRGGVFGVASPWAAPRRPVPRHPRRHGRSRGAEKNIAEAKRRLALTLGVETSSIKITVEA